MQSMQLIVIALVLPIAVSGSGLKFAAQAKLDINQKVYIEGSPVLGDGAGDGALNKCRAFAPQHVSKPAEVKVCGTGIKMTAYLLGECKDSRTPDLDVRTYSKQIGKCDSKQDASTCVTYSPHTVQDPESLRITWMPTDASHVSHSVPAGIPQDKSFRIQSRRIQSRTLLDRSTQGIAKKDRTQNSVLWLAAHEELGYYQSYKIEPCSSLDNPRRFPPPQSYQRFTPVVAGPCPGPRCCEGADHPSGNGGCNSQCYQFGPWKYFDKSIGCFADEAKARAEMAQRAAWG